MSIEQMYHSVKLLVAKVDSFIERMYHPFMRNTQMEILDFIKAYWDEKGFSPSLREVAEGMEYKSVSTAAYHVARLENRGYVRRQPGVSRGMVVL